MFMSVFILTNLVHLDGLLFTSMSIYMIDESKISIYDSAVSFLFCCHLKQNSFSFLLLFHNVQISIQMQIAPNTTGAENIDIS